MDIELTPTAGPTASGRLIVLALMRGASSVGLLGGLLAIVLLAFRWRGLPVLPLVPLLSVTLLHVPITLPRFCWRVGCGASTGDAVSFSGLGPVSNLVAIGLIELLWRSWSWIIQLRVTVDSEHWRRRSGERVAAGFAFAGVGPGSTYASRVIVCFLPEISSTIEACGGLSCDLMSHAAVCPKLLSAWSAFASHRMDCSTLSMSGRSNTRGTERAMNLARTSKCRAR
eukprot:5870612-Amphidinium_carterae.2